MVGWMCLLAIFAPLIGFAYLRTTPAAWLRTAFDLQPPPATRIQRIQAFDSFNDGNTIAGMCSASPQFVETLIATHALTASARTNVFHQAMPDEPLPEDAEVFEGSELTIYYDPNRSLLYFYRRPGQRHRHKPAAFDVEHRPRRFEF